MVQKHKNLNNEHPKITVIGDIMLDEYISGDVDRISPEAPVPVLLKSDHFFNPGGAANVAVNLAALNISVDLIGVVGKDRQAQQLYTELEKWEAIKSHFIEISTWKTITKTRIMSGKQQIVRVDREDLFPFAQEVEKQITDATLKSLKNSDLLILSDYAKGILSDRVLKTIIDDARSHNILILADPKRKDFSAYQDVDIITPNQRELALATGFTDLSDDNDVMKALEKARAIFKNDILLTRSEKGMILYKKNGDHISYKAKISEVYDVSGAGDTVIATLGAALVKGYDLERAIQMAMLAASFVIRRKGVSYITQAQLNQEIVYEHEQDKLGTKIYSSFSDASEIITKWKHAGFSIVLTNGCFDLLHPGHLMQLKEASKKGDKLIIALNSDASIKRLKGEERPISHEQTRAFMLSEVNYVDMIIFFDDDTPYNLIKKIRPHILVKGSDYSGKEIVGCDIVEQYGGRVILIPIIDGYSTTSIIKKIKNLGE